jgi:glycerate dehydrogenase
VLATGYNIVDCEAAKKRGIPVCNVPAYGTDAVAQFTFALLLELCHRAGLHSDSVHNGDWCRSADFCYWLSPQMELSGKTMGIIGFGRIGRAVGKIANAFGMQVLAYNRSRCPEGEEIGTYVDLDTLLKESDVVSLHCPLTPQTERIINADSLRIMKDGAILLNTARGPLIDQQAVVDALKAGKLRSFAADVVCAEPMAADNPLMGAPNCILTPHMAWAPTASRQRLMNTVVSNTAAFLEGKPQNVVN